MSNPSTLHTDVQIYWNGVYILRIAFYWLSHNFSVSCQFSPFIPKRWIEPPPPFPPGMKIRQYKSYNVASWSKFRPRISKKVTIIINPSISSFSLAFTKKFHISIYVPWIMTIGTFHTVYDMTSGHKSAAIPLPHPAFCMNI